MSCVMTHADLLADLDQVGKMSADMKKLLAFPMVHLICQKLDVYSLYDPRGRGFQVLQEDIADHVTAIQDLPLGLCIHAQVREDPVL